MARLTAHTKSTAGLNSGAETVARKASVASIKAHPTFQALLPINERELDEIVRDMRENGFDKTKPVCVWKEEGVLIDGYTRVTAAKQAGIDEIYKYEASFASLREALEYAIKQQLNRRNLDDAGKLLLIEKIDYIKKTGRPAADEARAKGKSAEDIAEALGVSARTVERARAVLKNADDETLDKVRSGKLSINKAEKQTKERKSAAVTPDRIEDNSGNPRGLVPSHPDGAERPASRPSPEEDTERTRERREAYQAGKVYGMTTAFKYVTARMLEGMDIRPLYAEWFMREPRETEAALEAFTLPEADEKLIRAMFPQDSPDEIAATPEGGCNDSDDDVFDTEAERAHD